MLVTSNGLRPHHSYISHNAHSRSPTRDKYLIQIINTIKYEKFSFQEMVINKEDNICLSENCSPVNVTDDTFFLQTVVRVNNLHVSGFIFNVAFLQRGHTGRV